MSVRSVIDANGARLCVEEFGGPTDPAMLLVAGAESSMDWWDTALCEQLAEGGRRVVRFDMRDTGASTTYPPGEPGYTASDLVDDIVAIVAVLHLEPVHLVGISMGGGLAQQVAILHPHLVATLTLLSTSPAAPGNESAELPGMTPVLAEYFSRGVAQPDWSDERAVGDYFVDFERALSGTIPVDEERIRAIAASARRRSPSMASAGNHWAVAQGGDMPGALADISAPTLVIHGTHDPLFPLAHGEALARGIPGARLLRIEGMGHQNPPPPTWSVVVPALLQHTRRAPGTPR